jgi:hypothetical protein
MQTITEERAAIARAQHRQSTFWLRFAWTALRFTIVVVLAGIIGAGWYLARKGFSRQWRTRVIEELHKRGVEASIGRLTLDPFRGLIARDVRIFSYKNRANKLAVVSEISLDINYAALFHHESFLNALDIRNAQITLPLKSPDGKVMRPQLNNFQAHIYFPPEQIYVSQAEGVFCGVRISATGQLIKRDNFQPSRNLTEEEWQNRLDLFRRIVGELQKFSFPGLAPSLQAKFSGDLGQLEDARVEATLKGERLKRKNYEMRDLFATIEWSGQTLNITQCEWKDQFGAFAATANWSRQTDSANFQARSSLDLKTLLDAAGVGGSLGETNFLSPPIVDLSGSANFSGDHLQIKIIGHASVDRIAYKNIPLSDLRAEFSWDGEHTWLRDIRLRHQTGEIHADILDAPNDFRFNIDSSINPGALRSVNDAKLQEFLRDWEWARSPSLHLVITGPDREPKHWRGDGTIALDRTRFRGVWMNNATAKVHFADGAVTYDDLHVTRDEGVGAGSFTYDFAKHEVRISNIKSTLKPVDAAFWIDPDLWKTVVPYKFHQQPTIVANGVYQFAGGKNTKLDINIEAPSGLDYVFLGKTLPFDKTSARLLFTDDRLQIVDLRAGLFGGNVRGGADISLAKGNPRFHANIAVNNVDFPHLTDLYWNYKTARGALNGTYDFGGFGTDARKMNGAGKINVTNGDVFAIPIFGPLSGIVNSVLPGTSGYSIAHEANANFTIKDGIIHTDNLEIAGKLFSIIGAGDIHFLDDKLDLDIHVDSKGAGMLLAPVYKLFEYKGEGSLKKPDWHPKRF